ncbi:hypothetical protein OAS39_02145 [Pirellulales bacterium]|nr:hypothetical protein [Pirellulales bacterium]
MSDGIYDDLLASYAVHTPGRWIFFLVLMATLWLVAESIRPS